MTKKCHKKIWWEK